jgi:hypothetical protein
MAAGTNPKKKHLLHQVVEEGARSRPVDRRGVVRTPVPVSPRRPVHMASHLGRCANDSRSSSPPGHPAGPSASPRGEGPCIPKRPGRWHGAGPIGRAASSFSAARRGARRERTSSCAPGKSAAALRRPARAKVESVPHDSGEAKRILAAERESPLRAQGSMAMVGGSSEPRGHGLFVAADLENIACLRRALRRSSLRIPMWT